MKMTKNSLIAFAGIAGGSALGMGVNLWKNSSALAKCIKFDPSFIDRYFLGNQNLESCKNPLADYDFEVLGHPVLNGMNRLKQFEIENFVFGIPYLPLLTDIVYTCASKVFNEGIKSGCNELKVRLGDLPIQKLSTPALAWWIGTAIRPSIGRILSSHHPESCMYRFNPSGHTITKLAAAMSLYQSLEAVQDHVEKTQSTKKRFLVSTALAAAISATDTIMMFNTAAIHHSLAEMIAGGVIFTAIFPVANLITSLFVSKKTKELNQEIEKLKAPNVTVIREDLGVKFTEIAKDTHFAAGALGKSTVHNHIFDKSLVVKKTDSNIIKEFIIGNTLGRHPLLTTARHLFVRLTKDGQFWYEMTMDKINGTTLENEKNLSVETIKGLLEQGKEACRYLFKNRCVWKDMNPGNIFITKDGLKLCDYGEWYQAKDSTQATKGLLFGAMQMITMILMRAQLYSHKQSLINDKEEFLPVKNRRAMDVQSEKNYRELCDLIRLRDNELDQVYNELINPVIYPKEFFSNRDECNELLYIKHNGNYEHDEPFRTLFSTFSTMSDRDKLGLLEQFFDVAIAKVDEVFRKERAANKSSSSSSEGDSSSRSTYRESSEGFSNESSSSSSSEGDSSRRFTYGGFSEES